MVEREPEELSVVGSIPTLGTILRSYGATNGKPNSSSLPLILSPEFSEGSKDEWQAKQLKFFNLNIFRKFSHCVLCLCCSVNKFSREEICWNNSEYEATFSKSQYWNNTL